MVMGKGGAGGEKKRSVACSERREALRRMLRGKEKSISRAAAQVGDERYKVLRRGCSAGVSVAPGVKGKKMLITKICF